MGFEPTVPFRITGFQDQLHKPLGHPSTDSLVRRTGIEPVRPFGSADFKSAASACSATLAYVWRWHPDLNWGIEVLQTSALPLGYAAIKSNLERKTRFEWRALALARRCSTAELLPHTWCLRAESNCRHEDFQSSALPTELPRRVRLSISAHLRRTRTVLVSIMPWTANNRPSLPLPRRCSTYL